MQRRAFLNGLIGCSVAASPLITPISFASGNWDHRLVVIILRGGMDGLDVVQPVGDPGFAALRSSWPQGQAAGLLDLDGYFAMHPGFATLLPLWQVGELGFAHAVSTPYRNKRSHFDGQDVLEAGFWNRSGGARRDGWLNRLLQVQPGLSGDVAYAIGRERMLLMTGGAPVSEWAPDIDVNLSPQALRLLELVMEADPLFHHASAEAFEILDALKHRPAPEDDSEEEDMMTAPTVMAPMADARRGSVGEIADFAANRLRRDARIASFSINGWDSHRNQRKSMTRNLGQLAEVILRIRSGLGPVWGKTAIIAMTEFGRTARANGTGGTDHGTGGVAVLAGGALKGGQVWGDWPGVAEADLFDRRDLTPTGDVRSYAAGLLQGLFSIEDADLRQRIFPGLDTIRAPKTLLRSG